MRLPDQILKCVCFLCVKDIGSEGETMTYGGTGFFVSVPSESIPGRNYVYLVTAKHNVEKAKRFGNLFLRINTTDGGAQFIEVSDEWIYSDNEAVDVAILPYAPPGDVFQYTRLDLNGFATTDRVIGEHGIGIGDELAVIGLFTRQVGKQRNLPIARTGIIASMPEEPLMDDSGLPYDAYLAEVRSIGGLSGSPVFVILEPGRAHEGKIDLSRKFFLLGLIRGHWDYRNRGAPLDFVGDELKAVNMGMAIVTPIQEVLATINSEEWKMERRRIDKEQLRQEGPTDDSE